MRSGVPKAIHIMALVMVSALYGIGVPKCGWTILEAGNEVQIALTQLGNSK